MMISTPKIMFATSMYLYAIAELSEGQKCAFSGIEGQPVYFIPYRDVALVVSEVSQTKIRPERKNLASHHEVLKQLMVCNVTILPIRFGNIAKGSNEVHKLLALHYSNLREQLKRVSGRVEMGAAVSWDVPNIFQYFIERHPELKEARDHLLLTSGGPSRDEKIEVGELFSRILNQEREAFTQQLISLLSPVCVDIVHNSLRNEMEVMNLACLIPREGQVYFEAKINEVATLWDDHLIIKYTGPWPPHNFTQFNLEL